MSSTRALVVVGERAQCRLSRPTSAPGTPRTSPTRVTEMFVRRGRDRRSLQGAAGEPRRRITSRACTCTRRAARRSRRIRSRSAAALVRNDVVVDPRRRGRGVHAERPVPRPMASVWSTTTPRSTTPSRTARATKSTRAFSAARARAVFNGKIIVRQDAQKTDAKQTNRALLLSDDAHDQHQAAARDLRRRREVHARRGDRPARRRRALLPAGAGRRRTSRRATC